MFNFLFDHSPLLYLTQSLWRDEAYSVLLSQHSVIQIIKLTAQDFNPPLYYLILHFWLNLFGSSEIAIRLLSFIFHLLLVYVCYLFAKKIFKSSSSNFQLLASGFVFLNPMLIYYAFEARMYSLLALLATASMYFFYTKNRLGYIISTALGLWTQPFMIFIPFCQAAFLIFTKKFSRLHFFNFLFSFLIFLPWLPSLLSQLKNSSSSWLWPINFGTPLVILGSLFTGYEGTPDGFWGLMGIISLAIILLALYVLRHAEFSSASPPEEILKQVQDDKIINFIHLLLCWLFLPAVLVLTISIFKPIYVARYLIFVSVAEIFLIVFAIFQIKNYRLRLSLSAFCFLFSVFLLFQSVNFHRKQDIRQTMAEINYLAKPNDIILSKTPLTFLEANYYAHDSARVFLYNPNWQEPPVYVGRNLMPKEKWRRDFPLYPKRAFLINDDASYEMVYQK